MTMSSPIQRHLKVTAIGAVLIFCYGLLLGLFGLGFSLAFGSPLPNWKWWHYLFGVFGLGLFALLGEVAFSPLRRTLIDADRLADQLWKRGLRAFAVFAIGAAFVAAAVVLREYGVL